MSQAKTTQIKWVPLVEKYPPTFEVVLLCMDDGEITVGSCQGINWHYEYPSTLMDTADIPVHWACFPKTPNKIF